MSVGLTAGLKGQGNIGECEGLPVEFLQSLSKKSGRQAVNPGFLVLPRPGHIQDTDINPFNPVDDFLGVW